MVNSATGMQRPWVHSMNDRSAFVSHHDGTMHEIPRDHLPPGQQPGQPLDEENFMRGHQARISGQPVPWQQPGRQQQQAQVPRIPDGFVNMAPPQTPPTAQPAAPPPVGMPVPQQAPVAPQMATPVVPPPLPPAASPTMQMPPQAQAQPQGRPANPYNDAVRSVTAPPMSYAPDSRQKFMNGLGGGGQ